MKKIIRITESDITRIVRNIISEQYEKMSDEDFTYLYNELKKQGTGVKIGNHPKRGKFLYAGMWVIWADSSINNGYPISVGPLPNGAKLYKWKYDTYSFGNSEIEDKSGKEYNLSDITTIKPSSTSFRKVSESNFNQIIKTPNKLVVIDFGAEWCVPCKKMKLLLSQLTSDPKLKDKFIVGTYDCTDGFDLPLLKKYNITSIPYVMLFRNGNLVHKFSGFKDKETLKSIINKY